MRFETAVRLFIIRAHTRTCERRDMSWSMIPTCKIVGCQRTIGRNICFLKNELDKDDGRTLCITTPLLPEKTYCYYRYLLHPMFL